MPTQKTDTDLIRAYRKSGDLHVLSDLYKPYIPLVFGVCMKYLRHKEQSEDAVMEIFEALIEKLKKHDVQNFKSWLHVLTRNHCLMIMRSADWKNKQHIENISDISVEIPSLMHHENGKMPSDANLVELQRCIEKLQDEQRRCISLFYLEEQSYKQIAEVTDFELKKVKSYIQNGKRNLKLCIERNRENI